MEMTSQPRSQGSLLPALRSERERDPGNSVGRVGENPGNEVDDFNWKYIHLWHALEETTSIPSLPSKFHMSVSSWGGRPILFFYSQYTKTVTILRGGKENTQIEVE